MATTNSNKVKISPQKIADVGYVIDEYEKKLRKQNANPVMIDIYRGLKQTEDLLDQAAQTVSPQQVALNQDIKKAQGIANDAIKDFYSNANSAKRTFTLDNSGLEFNNTIAALANQENTAEQKAATLLRDCLPCETRLISLLMYNPLDVILKALVDLANHLKKVCTNLISALLNPTSFHPNLCNLLNIFNFTCIPDLNALLMMLKRYATLKLKPEIPKTPSGGAIVGALISPILGIVTNIVSTWSKLVLGPVECVLTELRKQIRKIGFAKVGSKDPITAAMKEVEKFLSEAQKEVKAWVEKMLQKYKSMVKMFMRSITKGAKLSIDMSKIYSMVSIISSLMNIYNFDIQSCGSKTTKPEEAAKRAADDLKKNDKSRLYLNTDLDTIDTLIPANDLTKEEREALGLPAPIDIKLPIQRRAFDGSVVSGNAEDVLSASEGVSDQQRQQITKRYIKGVTLSFTDCPELASKSFLPVDNLINAFEVS